MKRPCISQSKILANIVISKIERETTKIREDITHLG